ncbi:hypothetical protein ACHAXR_006526, partial [Thalassiosira sp. AJA248-18]
QRRRLLGYSGRTATRWILTIVAGLLTGLTSIFLVFFTGAIVQFRARIMHDAINNWGKSLPIFQIFLWTNLILALFSSILCVAWSPPAAGSGIPEVKAYLNGVRSMQKLANWPLFLVKIMGTILSVSSALSVGQEGPLIHIGAIMGASCTKIGGALSNILIHWNSRRNKRKRGHRRGRAGQHHQQQQQQQPEVSWTELLLDWTLGELSHFATDAERRDLVSIGASVGFAASFGAPIGGLLFILDDISSYFERQLLLRMLVANAIGTFCLAVKHGDLSNYSIISMGTYETPNDNIFINRLVEVPLYVLVGLGGGVLGGIFSWAYLWLRRNITSKFPPAGEGRSKWQLSEVAVVSILSSIVLFYLPRVSWACKQVPEVDIQYLEAYEDNQAYRREEEQKRFFCPAGEINEMATVMFGSRIDAIRDILSDPSAFEQRTLICIGFVFYILTLITFGTTIPAGIFTPTVLIGAALGGACGNAFHQYVDEEISPSTFALLGVAAMLAGVQRSTVSVAVILVEGTGQIKVLSPVIIVVVISRYVAQSISTLGIFETVIDYKSYPYLPHEHLKRYYDAVQVKEIMSEPPLEVLCRSERVGDLVDLLKTSNHNGFPVVESGTGRFLGLIRRAQIAALIECGVFSKQRNIQGEEDLVAAAFGIQIGGDSKNSESTPLMHWAYLINDDRYGHILSIPDEENPVESLRSRNVLIGSSIGDENDEFVDYHAHSLLTEEQLEVNESIRLSLMPTPIRGSTSSSFSASSLSEIPCEFGTVTRNAAGNVVVSWYNAEFEQYWVDLAAAANRGTYTVPEFCPVSKAYKLFTALGLRHIVVLGGHTGGEVVGILTRASFLESHIEDESGL